MSDFSQGCYTDEEGIFSLKIKEEDLERLNVVVSFLGYEKQVIRVNKIKDDVLVRLKYEEELMENVVIVASPFYSSGNDIFEYDNDNNKYKLFMLGGKDMARSLQSLPGITRTDNAQIKLRGFKSDKTNTMVENIPVLKTGHYFNIISTFNELYFDNVEIYKNQYPNEFGNALGGLVKFNSADVEKTVIKTTSNLLYSGVSAAIKFDDVLKIKIGGRKSYIGINNKGWLQKNLNQLNLDTLSDINGIYSSTPNNEFYDINAKVELQYHKKANFQINFVNSNDLISQEWSTSKQFLLSSNTVVLNQSFSNQQKNTNRALSLKNTFQLNNKHIIELEAYHYQFQDTFGLDNLNVEEMNGNSNAFRTRYTHQQKIGSKSIKALWRYRPTKQSDFVAGIEANEIDLEFKANENGNGIANKDQKASQSHIFTEGKYKTDQFYIKGGIKISKFNYFKAIYFQPDISLNYYLSDHLFLKGNYSHRIQNLNQLDFETRFAQNLKYYYLSEYQPLQISDNYMVGLRYAKNKFFIDAEGYINMSDGDQLFTTLINNIKGEPGMVPPKNLYSFFTGSSFSRGIDLHSGYSKGRWKGTISYTLSKITQKFNGIYRNMEIPSADDRRHVLNISNNINLGKLNLYQGLAYMSGTPYLSYKMSKDKGSKNDFMKKDAIALLPAYLSLDIGLDYKVQIKKTSITTGISISNLTNNANTKFIQQTGQIDDKNKSAPLITGNQALMLGRFINLHFSTTFN